jgi:TolA-binding protein
LLDGEGSEIEQRLLRACVQEEPAADGARRLAALLGVTAPGVVDAPVASAQGASQSIAPAAGSKLAGALWWLGGAGVVGGAALIYATLADPQPAPSRAGDEARSVSREGPASAAEPQAAHADDMPAVEDSRVEDPVARSIAPEIQALDVARAALHAGDAARALEALEAYARRYPGGVLRQESTALRVEALLETGDERAAAAIARRFLRDNPDSPHAKRVRSLLEGAGIAP